jgi:hypothetical protein
LSHLLSAFEALDSHMQQINNLGDLEELMHRRKTVYYKVDSATNQNMKT